LANGERRIVGASGRADRIADRMSRERVNKTDMLGRLSCAFVSVHVADAASHSNEACR